MLLDVKYCISLKISNDFVPCEVLQCAARTGFDIIINWEISIPCLWSFDLYAFLLI